MKRTTDDGRRPSVDVAPVDSIAYTSVVSPIEPVNLKAAESPEAEELLCADTAPIQPVHVPVHTTITVITTRNCLVNRTAIAFVARR